MQKWGAAAPGASPGKPPPSQPLRLQTLRDTHETLHSGFPPWTTASHQKNPAGERGREAKPLVLPTPGLGGKRGGCGELSPPTGGAMSFPGALRPLEDPSEAAAEQEAELLREEHPGDLGEGALGLAAQVQQRGPQERDAEAEAEENAPISEGGLQVPPEPRRHPLVPPHPRAAERGRPRRCGSGAARPRSRCSLGPGPAAALAPAFAGCDSGARGTAPATGSASGTGNRRRLPGPGLRRTGPGRSPLAIPARTPLQRSPLGGWKEPESITTPVSPQRLPKSRAAPTHDPAAWSTPQGTNDTRLQPL